MPSALKHQLATLAARGAFSEAVAIARTAVNENGQSAEAWCLLSHAYELSRDVLQAREAADRAIELDAGEPAYRFQRGWLYLVAGDSGAALDDMRAVFELGVALGDGYYAETARFIAAEALRRLGRCQEALQCVRMSAMILSFGSVAG